MLLTDHLNSTSLHINALLDRCLQNDAQAQLEVYNTYYKMVYNTSYRIMQNVCDAEDMMQETFITAFDKLDTFKRLSNYQENVVPFGSWLKKIAIRKSINSLRKSEKWLHNETKEVFENEEEDNGTEEWVQTKVTEILQTLPLLKSNYRSAFTLYYIEGYDLEEIAEIMAISYQNARTTVTRAKQKLREMLYYNEK